MDLTDYRADVQNVEARKNLWKLIEFYTRWMEEWKQSVFCEVIHLRHLKHTLPPLNNNPKLYS